MFLFSHSVPPPDVDVTVSHTAPLYAGTSLTLTCTVTLDPNVDNGENITTEWSDISRGRYSVTAASGSGSTYTGSLTISPLADQDDGTYTCTGTVTGGTNVLQATASDAVTITVMGKYIVNLTISVEKCPTSLPSRPPRSRCDYLWSHYWHSWRGVPVDM